MSLIRKGMHCHGSVANEEEHKKNSDKHDLQCYN